jgi:hypothetical protein
MIVGIMTVKSGTPGARGFSREARESRAQSLRGSPILLQSPTPGKMGQSGVQNEIFSRPPRDSSCNNDCAIDTIKSLIRTGCAVSRRSQKRSSGSAGQPTIDQVIAPRQAQDFLELGHEDCYTAETRPGRNLKFPVFVLQ